MTTSIIVQARMTSTRLPGKILLEVNGKPLLTYLIERLRMVTLADNVVIATTSNATDDPVVSLCEDLDCLCYRGPEDDVLARYQGCAERYPADAIVRITSDCPLIDPKIIDQMIERYSDNREQVDYVSNTLVRTYPRGMDCEVFSRRALSEAYEEAIEPSEREHVTPFIYRRPERYRLDAVALPQDLSRHRWTVDTPDDFKLVKRMLEKLGARQGVFSLNDCIDLINEHPEWAEINSHIEQKAH